MNAGTHVINHGESVEIMIPVRPVTKKNSQNIFVQKETGRRFVYPSKAYVAYKKECAVFLRPLGIDVPVNTKILFYLPTKQTADLSNLVEAIHDILQEYGTIIDDDCRHIVSTDGSRVYYDKDNPRTEIYITAVDPTFPPPDKKSAGKKGRK